MKIAMVGSVVAIPLLSAMLASFLVRRFRPSTTEIGWFMTILVGMWGSIAGVHSISWIQGLLWMSFRKELSSNGGYISHIVVALVSASAVILAYNTLGNVRPISTQVMARHKTIAKLALIAVKIMLAKVIITAGFIGLLTAGFAGDSGFNPTFLLISIFMLIHVGSGALTVFLPVKWVIDDTARAKWILSAFVSSTILISLIKTISALRHL